jgi:hypothetical protein
MNPFITYAVDARVDGRREILDIRLVDYRIKEEGALPLVREALAKLAGTVELLGLMGPDRRYLQIAATLALTAFLAACGSKGGPTGPTPTADTPTATRAVASFYTPGQCAGQCRIDAALALVDYVQTGEALPWTSQPAGAWFRAQGLTVAIVTYAPEFNIAADCCADNVLHVGSKGLGPILSDGELVATAATLLHEARHKQFPHSCADARRDRTEAELGAWGVQTTFMEWVATKSTNLSMSDASRADILSFVNTIRGYQFCGAGQ